MLRTRIERPTIAGFAWLVIALFWTVPAGSVESDPENSGRPPAPVPVEDYPIYDRVIMTKFLTAHTGLVVIQKLTANRLQPEGPPVSRAYFEDNPVFNNALPAALITDFLLKNVQPSSLEGRFNFGVRYRLVSGDSNGPEVAAAIPVQLAVPDAAPATVGRVLFSRVGYARNLALVYVAEERRDGTGGGLLILLGREATAWTILDTEVLWMAQRDGESSQ
jgi:hypothetical protein